MSLILRFEDVSASDLPRVGGKGANLGEMARAGFSVPPGFCITTEAFDAFMSGTAGFAPVLRRMDALDGRDAQVAREVAEAARAVLEQAPIPERVREAVLGAWRERGTGASYAVRSSATAEDLPDASFAGQQDTYLNVRGEAALLDAVRRCWISLFTDRAVLYRARNRFRSEEVKLSVVVQRMVLPEVSGILFTADPISGRRGTVSIEASYGLGEALVGGLVNADLYRVDKASGEVLEARIGEKALAIRPLPEGGTRQEQTPEPLRRAQVLKGEALRGLVEVGKRIEGHYGQPQDIEWCIEGGRLYIVQSRPITSLYPLPVPRPPDAGLHAYVSFGHIQMMTNPMPAFAVQVWQHLLPTDRAPATPAYSRSVTTAGSRIFLDLSPLLRRSLTQRLILALLGRVYPDIGEGLKTLVSKPEFARGAREGGVQIRRLMKLVAPLVAGVFARLLWRDPSKVRQNAEAFAQRQFEESRAHIESAPPGVARLRAAQQSLAELFLKGFIRVAANIPAGLIARDRLERLVSSGELRASPEDIVALDRGLIGNVTTEMDLAVGDLTDLVRANPALAELLRTRPAAEALRAASSVQGGAAFLSAWQVFMERFGMRGPGEVDVSRPRFRDDPAALVATLLGGLSAARTPGQHRAHHAKLAAEADAAADRLVAAAGGGIESAVVRRLTRVARSGLALREHPKFLLVRILALVRAAALECGALLVKQSSLERAEDVFLFRFEEVTGALEGRGDLRQAAKERRATLERDAQRTAPFIVSSDGEIPALAPRADLPPGALSGTAASSGVVEGLARVVRDPSAEVLHAGEILVAPHTDPGWTPLFVHAAGLVTEVGGLITHGSVVAREYGIPAVVSVANATQRIHTGQRIRVDGTRGLVEFLDGEAR